ncbi:hypothetical protein MPSEU_000250600 [Mayamaea pseudoterrestris]|nr:hypothetical protein MPSEU_000250600 [Mayamaea pseudoterrestris]
MTDKVMDNRDEGKVADETHTQNEEEDSSSRVDLWWSSIAPQYQFRRKLTHQEHDSISSAQETTSVTDLEESCDHCCTQYFPCFGSCRRKSFQICQVETLASSRQCQVVHVNWKNLILALFASVMLGVVLYTKSSIRGRWFLNVGLNRRLNVPYWLSREMTVTSSQTDFPKSQLFVYHLGKHCPPFSPTSVTFKKNRTLQFGRYQYQNYYEYDFLYLNEGSRIFLEMTQAHGTSNVYVLRGQNVMERILNDAHQDNQGGFEKLALEKRTLSAGEAQVLRYNVTQSDDYIIVYEDASKKHGQLLVQYTVDATMFDVEDEGASVCDDPLGDCTIRLSLQHECIIVQAKPDANEPFGQAVMFVTIKTRHRVGLIFLLSVIPLALALLISCIYRDTAPIGTYEPIGDVDLNVNASPSTFLYQDSIDSSLVGIKFVNDTTQTIPILKGEDLASAFGSTVRISPSSIVHV